MTALIWGGGGGAVGALVAAFLRQPVLIVLTFGLVAAMCIAVMAMVVKLWTQTVALESATSSLVLTVEWKSWGGRLLQKEFDGPFLDGAWVVELNDVLLANREPKRVSLGIRLRMRRPGENEVFEPMRMCPRSSQVTFEAASIFGIDPRPPHFPDPVGLDPGEHLRGHMEFLRREGHPTEHDWRPALELRDHLSGRTLTAEP